MSWVWQAQGGGSSGGGASAARVPALQSNIASAVAMWALRTDQPTKNIDGTDRSGNGYTLNPVQAAYNAPDLIPGQCCLIPWKTFTTAPPVGLYPAGAQRNINTAALQMTGSMSITCRAWYPTYADAGTAPFYSYLLGCAEYSDGTAAGNALYTLVLSNAGDRPLGYFAQNGVHAGISFFSTLKMNDAKWAFVSMTRNAATGIVTLGINGSYQSSGVLANPTGGTNAKMYIGRPPTAVLPSSPNDIGWAGGIADVCVWPSELSTAQVEQLRAQAMGL